jgi:hypothetical protein
MPARTIVLALAAISSASAATTNAPSVSMNLKHAKMGGGLNVNSVEGDFKVESKVSDDVSLGVNLSNGDAPLKSVFGKFSQKFGNGNVNADLTMTMSSNAIAGDVTYSENGNKLTFDVDSASSDVVNKVSYEKSGSGWSFHPTFNLKAKTIDLEASADYSADTNVNVALKADGSSTVEVNHRLDADTSVNVKGSGADLNGMAVEVSRSLDKDNTVKPKFDMATKHLTLAWVRKLDAGRTLTVDVDPEKSMKVELEGANDEDWSASVASPWGNFADADVSFGRKFQF